MRCTNCQTDNPPENRFCEQCGTALELRCSQCGALVRSGARFCGACGYCLSQSETQVQAFPARPPVVAPDYHSRLASYTPKHLVDKIFTTRSALEGERRQVTVLFADTAGFTTLAEKLDPEDVHQILDHCFELITSAVHRFEGTINQYTGDGVMALFGAPIAHEDSPRRAVHAALAIQQALRDFNKELQTQRGFSLHMRIGLNTGLVVVGKIGDDLRMDYTAVGDTTNVAARMQQLARLGSVVVSEATHKLIEGFFETLDLGEQQVKGHTPVRAFEVLRPRGRRARLDVAVERGLTPLIGRERELATLLDLFREVKAGRSQVVLVTGEAGIGKSRLLLELRRALVQAGEDVTWLEGRCISFGQSIPLLPLIDQLRENFRIEEFDGEPEIIAKVEHGMRRLGGLEVHIPYIRYLLSVDPGDPAISAMEPLVRRKRIFEAVQTLSLRGARLRSLVLVYEDLHWIDSSSEEYLSSFVDSVAGFPLMLILTYRVGYNPPFGSRSFFTTLNLHSLSEAETLTMAGRMLGTDQFPPELTTALMEKAEGVPLFVEEVTKTLLDLGVLRREDGGYRLVKGIAEVNVPDTIQGIIMARLDRLGEEGKRTVQLASVIGRQFLVRLLERISGFTSKLEGLLSELQTLEIIYRQGLLPEPIYIFKHAVIQDVAYNTLLIQRRKELHKAVAEAIEELYADRLTEHYEELAHHYEQGEEGDKALEYLVKAGQKLQQAYANQEALDFYARALEVCGKLGNAALEKSISVAQSRAFVNLTIGDPGNGIADLERMLQVARQLGDRRHEGLALAYRGYFELLNHARRQAEETLQAALALGQKLKEKEVIFTAQTCLVHLFSTCGCHAEAEAMAAAAEQLLPNVSDTFGLNATLGLRANFFGRFDEALEKLRQWRQSVTEQQLPLATVLLCDWTEALTLGGKGDYDQALTSLHKTLATCKRMGELIVQVRVLNTLGWIYGELQDHQRAMEWNTQSVEMAREMNAPEPEVENNARLNLGDNLLALGRREEAEEQFQKVEQVVRNPQPQEQHNLWRYSQHFFHSYGELWLARGDFDKALAFADECLVIAEQSNSRKNIIKGWRLQGQAYCAQGKLAEAEAVLQKALVFAKEIGNPPQLWKTYQALGELYEQQGATAQARSAYASAIEAIDGVADRLQDQDLKRTFLAAKPVQGIQERLRKIAR